MSIFVGGAHGALVKLKCPHCGEVQARARKPQGGVYACRRCHRRFARTEGEASPSQTALHKKGR